MATFDRFDILAAYNVFSTLWGWDDYTNRIQVRLARLDYKPADSETCLRGLSDNAREVYAGLVARHFETRSGYVPCACCSDPCMGTLVIGRAGQVPVGVDLCSACAECSCVPEADDCQVPTDDEAEAFGGFLVADDAERCTGCVYPGGDPENGAAERCRLKAPHPGEKCKTRWDM